MLKKYEPVCRKDYDAWKRLQDEPKQKAAADPRRLHYHLMPDIGWLNDPTACVSFTASIISIISMILLMPMAT